MIQSVKPTNVERLCERCPYPSRPAAYCVIVQVGTYRIKHKKEYLCARCTDKLQEEHGI